MRDVNHVGPAVFAGKIGVHVTQKLGGGFQDITVVFLAVSPDELPVFIHNSDFYRGRSGVDTHVNGPLLMEDVRTLDDLFRVALLELFAFGVVLEKRLQAR